jgi:DNA-directed RNA polymerase subunit RPC12/RpoP
MIKDHATPVCRCVNCGKELDAAAGFDKSPQAGDASLCLYCGHFMIFDDDLKVRAPTDDELRGWAGNEELVSALNVVNAIKMVKP